jgi:hypothetical protein
MLDALRERELAIRGGRCIRIRAFSEKNPCLIATKRLKAEG